MITHFFEYSTILLSLILIISCSEKSDSGLAITNANIISMETGEVEPNQTLLIQGNVITTIGDHDKVRIPSHYQIIDAAGKFLIPGLSDMHMHIDHPDVLKVHLAFGITTVMNYRGLPEHLDLRSKSKLNQIFSPIIYTTGDYMEGYPATFSGFLSFDNVEDAIVSVGQQKEAGYDFIKIYRNLDSLMLKGIGEAAEKHNMTIVGHLSPDISAEHSFELGQKVVAHAEEVMYFFDNENKTEKIGELVSLFKKYDVTFTPNLTIFKSIIDQAERIDSVNSQESVELVHPSVFQSWREENNYNHRRGSSKEWVNFMKKRNVFLREVTKQMNEAGVPILASTDAPTSGVVPGISVHHELRELVSIGLTPLEALRSATSSAGDFINQYLQEKVRFGRIKTGYRADILILDKNPLLDIKNTRQIHGVVKNGAWYGKNTLNRQMEDLATHYQSIDASVRNIERQVYREDIDEATRIYEEAKKEHPSDLFLGYYVMGYGGFRFLYQNQELTNDPIRAQKAIDHYKLYVNDYPEMHGSYYLLGMAYKAKKDTLNAIKYFEQSLKIHPFNPYARRQMNDLIGQ